LLLISRCILTRTTLSFGMKAMKGNFVYLKIGMRIASIRKKLNISQDHLSFIADMDRTYLTRLERGRANPSIRTLHKIARKLKVKMSTLLKDI
jgi:DNA-binding XRE family transcriptional regulator